MATTITDTEVAKIVSTLQAKLARQLAAAELTKRQLELYSNYIKTK